MTDVFDTAERRALRDTVRRFVQTDVLPHLPAWEEAGELPRSLSQRAGELGLLGISYPDAVGGGGGDAIDALVLAEEFHYAGGSSAFPRSTSGRPGADNGPRIPPPSGSRCAWP